MELNINDVINLCLRFSALGVMLNIESVPNLVVNLLTVLQLNDEQCGLASRDDKLFLSG